MNSFVHLHNHSVYSLLDGYISLKDLVISAKKSKAMAIAITDHGNMHGAVKFQEIARKYGIKPIIGIEAYMDTDINNKNKDDYHVLLLAKNVKGYENLCKLSYYANVYGFYRRPRVDFNLLKQYKDGLICTTACIKEIVQKNILSGNINMAIKILQQFKSIFGDDFYIEVQNSGLDEQKVINPIMIKLAKKLGIKGIVTVDAHYANVYDDDDHDTLLCISLRKKKADKNRYRYAKGQYCLKNEQEMKNLGFDKSYYTTTAEISYKCKDFNIPKAKGLPKEKDSIRFLGTKALQFLKRNKYPRYYIEQLKKELIIIRDLNYGDYFQIVYNIINYAKRKGYFIGWGRGSAVGSLLSFCLGITRIDPIKYKLYFERFLNKSRKEPPDIDLDFADDERQYMIDFLRKRYGDNQVMSIGTLNTLGLKQILRDVGRVLDFPNEKIDMACSYIPHDPSITIKDILKDKHLSMRIKEIIGEKVFNLLLKYEGLPRHASVHASGIIIDSESLINKVPVMVKNKILATQFEYSDLEKLGYTKFDLLGVKTLTVIREVCKQININAFSIPLNDKVTFDLLKRGDTIGVFQFEGYGYRQFLRRFRPSCYDDIMMANALYRPGPMQGGRGLEEVLNRRFGLKHITYLHPKLKPILNKTYGIMIYQEQVISVVIALTNWTTEEADMLRWTISKKKEEKIKTLKTKFIEDCIKNGHTKDFAAQIFEEIEFFARYGWNKAHASAYSMISYVTAYLKANYPEEYMAEMLNMYIGNPTKFSILVKECRHMKLKIRRPHINFSEEKFVVIKEDKRKVILPNLTCINGIGNKTAKAIIAERKNKGVFTSIENFRSRMPKTVVNSLSLRRLENFQALQGLSIE